MKKHLWLFLVISICTLGALPCLASGNNQQQLTIKIQPTFNQQPLQLETKKYISASNDTLQIEQFRFYISALELVYSDGKTYKENNSYHLIDASDSTSLNLTLSQLPLGEIKKIKFTIGVDSIKCTSGVFGGDLDPTKGMYWAWNSGYIHAKLEGSSKSCKTYHNGFEFHIGGFSYPNNALRTVELTINNTSLLVIMADAAAWLQQIDLKTTNSITTPGKEAILIANNYQNMFSVINK